MGGAGAFRINSSVINIYPAAVSLSTAVLSATTAALSVLLTYYWQAKWRRIDTLPFISDAYYDDIQSPIFAVTVSITAVLLLFTVLLTYAVSTARNYEYANHSFAVHAQARTRHHCVRFALIAGVLATLLLAVAASCSSKLRLHFIAISLSFVSSILWASAVTVTLKTQANRHDALSTLNTLCMQACVVLLIVAVVSISLLHSRNLQAAAAMEYVLIAAMVVFLLLLSVRLRGSTISIAVRADERLLETNGAGLQFVEHNVDNT